MPTMRVSFCSKRLDIPFDDTVELAPLRPARHVMGKPYVKAYFKYFPVSPPEEDQDDRNALYCLYAAWFDELFWCCC